MRVLVTGMGGQLGTQVARLLEARNDVESIVGYDIDPPRRMLARTEFHRLNPRRADQVARVVSEADPTVVVHLGVYEPHARIGPDAARRSSEQGTRALLKALETCHNVESVVVRSGVEVYGRRRGGQLRPDEDSVPFPTSGFGKSLLDVEQALVGFGLAAKVPVTALRFAPLVGSHFPSPLGRYLKLRVIPVGAVADPTFSVLHADDAAAAVLAAVDRRPDGPVNVVASGAVTPWQSALIGSRVPLPVLGHLGWLMAQIGSELVSAPLPDHVRELLLRGRVADGSRVEELLGMSPRWSTKAVLTELYEQSNVIFLPVAQQEPAA